MAVRCLRAVAAALLIAAAAAPALTQERKSQPPPALPAATQSDLLKAAKTWVFQLQMIDVAALARSDNDVVVLDTDLSKADVARLKRKPGGGRRLVVAYVNIGEAEDYRSYWRKSWTATKPPWLGSSNDHWKGDHRVRHWHPDWQAIVFGNPGSIFARLIAAGFDGAYLDRVDVYQFWCGERPSSFDDMIDFVAAMSSWSKAQKPGFLILPQNGEELLQSARYRAAIDGMGKEDLLFGDRGNDTQNYDTRIERAVDLLGHAHRAGLPVLAIEYARSPENQRLAVDRHRALGHVLYFGPRSLAYVGQSGPLHKEDGDSEPYYAARGPLGCGG